MTTVELLSRLQGVRKTASGWQAKCPAHEDSNASLSISEGSDSRILLKCHAGCEVKAICAASGIETKDLFANTRGTGGMNIVATYDYEDEAGNLLFQVCRLDPKSFRQRKPDPSAIGGWSWKIGGVRRVPFRLPELIAGVCDGMTVFVVEGEKDVEALVRAGFVATCNAGGAGKWQADFADYFKGATVVIIADKDAPGRKHAEDVAAKLQASAASIKVLELPDQGAVPVKDAADFFAAGGQAAQLQELIAAAPEWEPQRLILSVPAEGSTFEQVTAELLGNIVHAITSKESPAIIRKLICTAVLDALPKVGRLYHHQERRDFDSAMFFNAHTKTLLRLRSDEFVSWLSEWLQINRQDTYFKYVLSAIETAALTGPLTTGIVPEAYWASKSGVIYLSCGNGHVVKVSAQGVSVADNGIDGVLFAAGRTLAPWKLTDPQDIFATASLFRNAHTVAGHAPDLLRLWLYSLPTNPRSKPPLCLAGEIGSGKTRIVKGFDEFLGIPFIAHKVEENAESDFWPCCDSGGIFCLDNADTRCPWLADAVANAATDGCSQRRKLYTNSETVLLRARAWIAITTANPTFASDSGLADRLLLVRMARRDGETTSDSALTDEIAANRDAGLSHLCQTLQTALADTSPVPMGINKRHPDFASFAIRIGRALGREAEAVAALRSAEQDKANFCLENDAVAAALLGYLREAGDFRGTAADLLPHVTAVDGELKERLSVKKLGKRLSALWPHIASALTRAAVEKDRKGFTHYSLSLKSAEYAEFQEPIPEKSLREGVQGGFMENSVSNSANSAEPSLPVW